MSCVRAAQPSAKEVAQRRVRSLSRDHLLVTKVLIGMNVAIHVWSIAQGNGGGGGGLATRDNPLAASWALRGVSVHDGDWYRIVTAGFIHYGLFHVLFNMLALYQLGLTLEGSIGRLRFAGIYFAAIVGGSAGALLLSPNGLTAGASGGVFGLAAAAVIGLRQRGVSFANTGWGPILLINLLFNLGATGVSIGGHLGGLAAGLISGAVVLNPRRKPNPAVDSAVIAVVTAIGFALALWFAGHPR